MEHNRIALIASLDSLYLNSVADRLPDNGADCRVHSRRIAAACQYSNSFNSLCHELSSSLPPCAVIVKWCPVLQHLFLASFLN